jgi:hypothetical protein
VRGLTCKLLVTCTCKDVMHTMPTTSFFASSLGPQRRLDGEKWPGIARGRAALPHRPRALSPLP